jgi:hypothetical protein
MHGRSSSFLTPTVSKLKVTSNASGFITFTIIFMFYCQFRVLLPLSVYLGGAGRRWQSDFVYWAQNSESFSQFYVHTQAMRLLLHAFSICPLCDRAILCCRYSAGIHDKVWEGKYQSKQCLSWDKKQLLEKANVGKSPGISPWKKSVLPMYLNSLVLIYLHVHCFLTLLLHILWYLPAMPKHKSNISWKTLYVKHRI